MRMLHEDERELLLQPDDLSEPDFLYGEGDPKEDAMLDALAAMGRLRIVPCKSEGWTWDAYVNTDMAVKALRIDALIRQWGLGS